MSDPVLIALIVAAVPFMGALGKAVQWLADRQQARRKVAVTQTESLSALADKDELIAALRSRLADKDALIADLKAQLVDREVAS